MKHHASRELYAYWNARRGVRLAPNRSEIDPGAIRGVLGDSFMVTRDAAVDTVFRLAGTRICEMFGRELKGASFLSLWDTRSHDDLRALLEQAAVEDLGFVAGLTAQVDDGIPVVFEILLLPLYRAGTSEPRSIGVLTPLPSASHVYLQRISELKLESWRHVGPLVDDSIVPRYVNLPPEGHIRNGMVVISGGRA